MKGRTLKHKKQIHSDRFLNLQLFKLMSKAMRNQMIVLRESRVVKQLQKRSKSKLNLKNSYHQLARH